MVAGVRAAIDVVGADIDGADGVLAATEATDSPAVAEPASALLAATGGGNEFDGASEAAREDDCRIAPTWLSQPALNTETAATAATTANLVR